MSALDAATQAWLDQEDRHTVETIRKYGTYIQYVGGGGDVERAPFAYTVGLYGIGHPELVILGVGPETAAAVLNDLSARIRHGSDLIPGEILSFQVWQHRVRVEAVPNPGEIAFAANRFYQRPDAFSVPLLQLTHDDVNGHFPDEVGYSIPAWIQPRPGQWRA